MFQIKTVCMHFCHTKGDGEGDADRKVLLNLYRTIIRSKLDYGSIIYGSARKSYFEMLDFIHHQGLRLALGALGESFSRG